MKILAIYDNGGKTMDRYTIVVNTYGDREKKFRECLFCGNDPRGMSGWSSCQMGRHLGKKLTFEQLPELIQKFVQAQIAS